MQDTHKKPEIIIEEHPTPSTFPIRFAILIAILFIGFIVYHDIVPIYTDYLWFGEVAYRGVFSTIIQAKVTLFLTFGALFFAIFYTNVTIATRLAPEEAERNLMEKFGPQWGKAAKTWFLRVGAVVSAFFSLWAGRSATTSWQDWLNYNHGRTFHLADPLFGNDVSFYIFRLPFLNMLYDFLMSSLLITMVFVVLIHLANRAIETWAGLPEINRSVRAQILILLGLLSATLAFGAWLGKFDLLVTENGVFTGAGYTDVHYRLFAIQAQMMILAVTALMCIVSIRTAKDFRWPVIGVGAWLVVTVILANAVPTIAQKVQVEPNQLALEQTYIKRNIAFTRKGFGLEHVQEVGSFPADLGLTNKGITANRDTLQNVRLWDYDYLGKVYSQLQTIKPYYKFVKMTTEGTPAYDIDIDRYRIQGKLRQVMLGAREMDTQSLPPSAQTWQNQKLSYTHGYGVVMSPVNRIVEGGPDYFISGLPLTSSSEATELKISQPDIYYGQLSRDAVFVNTAQPEFDYPSTETAGTNGTQDHYSTYVGKGGIRIGDAPLAKLAFSLHLSDPLMLLQNGFKPQTKILYRREIRDRLQTIAPFLQQDRDPYLVVEPETGKLIWIIDCYTQSDRFPYSTPQDMSVNPVNYLSPNYIRNSIKATIDAYDGTVNLYIVDPTDPIAQTYADIYPGLLKPASDLPLGLVAHLRYPEDLFHIQRGVYATYHVDDPRVFYQKEDAWAIPVDPNSDQNAAPGSAAKRMEPYYVIMKLPGVTATASETSKAGGNGEEFLLMSPLAPVNREQQNILGWMCARCDPGHYGELVLYRFPQNVSVSGPNQIAQLINSDRVISPQLSLLRSGGSNATLGNLLVIPVDTSLLYIAPLYVEATGSATKLPQLQKVIVAFGQKVVMEDTLDRALATLFANGEATPVQDGSASQNPGPATPDKLTGAPTAARVQALISKASSLYDGAQARLKAGDFAGYGAQIKQMGDTLAELKRDAATLAAKKPKTKR